MPGKSEAPAQRCPNGFAGRWLEVERAACGVSGHYNKINVPNTFPLEIDKLSGCPEGGALGALPWRREGLGGIEKLGKVLMVLMFRKVLMFRGFNFFKF
jgi:hypothetical protein